jgi:hypothetical protein
MKTDKKKVWQAVLGAALLGLLIEFAVLHEKVFFIWYEPEIHPMSWWGTRLEALVMTPVAMIAFWWITFPLLGLGAWAVFRMRQIKRIPNNTSEGICQPADGLSKPST